MTLAASAAAQTGAESPPSTLTLDRMDSATRIGIQVGFDKLDRTSISDGFVMRYEPHAQLVLPGHGGGVYGHLPVAHVFDFRGKDTTGVGNLEIGGFLLPLNASELILRFGLILPSGSDSGTDVYANYLAAFERLTDLLLAGANYTVLRLSASTVQEVGIAFFRGDLGFDLALDKPRNGRDVFLRANAAAGLRLPGVDLSAELINIGFLDSSGSAARRFNHTGALAARTQGVDQVYVGMVFPLDEDNFRGEMWIFSLGYQHVMN